MRKNEQLLHLDYYIKSTSFLRPNNKEVLLLVGKLIDFPAPHPTPTTASGRNHSLTHSPPTATDWRRVLECGANRLSWREKKQVGPAPPPPPPPPQAHLNTFKATLYSMETTDADGHDHMKLFMGTLRDTSTPRLHVRTVQRD